MQKGAMEISKKYENSIFSGNWINSKIFALRFQKSFIVFSLIQNRDSKFLFQKKFSINFKKKAFILLL